MIEVDLNGIKEVINTYEEYIKTLDENNRNIIQEYNNIKNYWHDKRAINMYSSFEAEKKRIINNSENVKDAQKVYNLMYDRYKEVGNKIKCNLNSKATIDSKINNIKSEIKTIIIKYNNLGDLSFYHRRGTIRNQKESVKQLLKAFEKIENDIDEKFNIIKSIEKEINDKINNLEIEIFALNNYEGEE